MQAHCLHIKVSELNTPSDGNGITGIPSAVFFNEMGNKKKKWELKRKENIYANCRSWTLSHFSQISNDCKSNVSAHQSCTIEQSFGWKRNYRHT